MSEQASPSRQIVVVTGGSRGIGAAIALDLASLGADVAVTGRDLERLTSVCSQIQERGGRCLPLAFDITDVSAIDAAITQIEETLGPIDLLVNNAGVNIPRPALEVTESQWDTVLNTNLKAVFFSSQAVGGRMIERRRGVIINIASAAGLLPAEDRAAYCSSKAGVVMLTRELALEWARFGVRVNAIAPTFVDTELAAQTLSQPGMRDYWTSRIPLGRLASVDDVAKAVRYLASPAADFITGVTLPVDGGLTLT